MKKANWFSMGMVAGIIILYCMGSKAPEDRNLTILTMLVDHTARIIDLERKEPYDPNAQELSFLEPADPNWIRDFGDNERTRIVHQISKNRVMILRDEQIISEIAGRLLALEAKDSTIDVNDLPIQMNSFCEDPEQHKGYHFGATQAVPNPETLWQCSICMSKDPNDPNEVPK